MTPKYLLLISSFLASFVAGVADLPLQYPFIYNGLNPSGSDDRGRRVSAELFWSLEELSRLADIAYCVGSTGIREPFSCNSHCDEFDGFELVDVSILRGKLRCRS